MSVSTVTPSSSVDTTSSSTSSAMQTQTMDYDSFLQLMVTQMKNQDPTEPTDMGEQMGQLASFSNVEQNIQTNNKLDAVLSQLYVNQSASLIGKTITTTNNISGQIESVGIYSDGVVAKLQDGTDVLIGPGVTIS
ncbi:flagellar hook assembly protein FlgD [Cohaesibacter celericrescens]|uniref:Basal-body rod modification protein FlgD n=1 Tax=Cohaesibacter celericrescens TaxID=2067669 RepID=A0A2N5XM07_9HYPH|nr:flagellar hook assembly protein FlgD [Cohaesibacter celericrescens]PLW75524.1 flagellar biosynthesis protein FlgD [Cohaesibacter celericrescens]PLW78931.1 flagellar biosynthesis protein FlgD [Cohaesibacter celericrescens]